jgi:hypothetical protein
MPSLFQPLPEPIPSLALGASGPQQGPAGDLGAGRDVPLSLTPEVVLELRELSGTRLAFAISSPAVPLGTWQTVSCTAPWEADRPLTPRIEVRPSAGPAVVDLDDAQLNPGHSIAQPGACPITDEGGLLLGPLSGPFALPALQLCASLRLDASTAEEAFPVPVDCVVHAIHVTPRAMAAEIRRTVLDVDGGETPLRQGQMLRRGHLLIVRGPREARVQVEVVLEVPAPSPEPAP